MLMVNQLVGFGAFSGISGASLGGLITGGTNIGNLTTNGGIASAFDGVTNQGAAASAAGAGANGYIGKTISKRVFKSITYGPNDTGYNSSGNPSVTIYLYGKVGSAPASGTDGVALGSVTFTDTANESGNPREVVSSNNVTVWDHIWVYVVTGADNVLVAEAQFYEAA